MGTQIIDTKTLMDDFFNHYETLNGKKSRSSVDRPEVYAFEKKTGKKLLELNPDELLEMIGTFTSQNAHSEEKRSISLSSYSVISYMFRKIWDYYSDNYALIRNPWNNSKLKGAEARMYLAQFAKVLKKDKYDELIVKIQNSFEIQMANYLECMVLLFYEGVENVREIPFITENSINTSRRLLYLPGRTIKMSERLSYLIQYVHNLTTMPGYKYDYTMASWRGSYLKFVIRETNAANFDEWDLRKITVKISQLFTMKLSKEFGMTILPEQFYNLGLYMRLIDKFGEEGASKMVKSLRNPDYNQQLMRFMEENNYKDSVTRFKYEMIPYFAQ